jgi:DNA-binding GntR family transcriptional regulator
MIQPAPPFQTKEEYAYQALRGAILRCELPPDEKLVIDRLSVEMGLSQIPIRAAIQRLQTEGLVVINPHSSATVAPLSPDKIDEVFALLESLERTAFRFAAQNCSSTDLTALDLLIDQMDIALSENDSAAWLTANIAFHRKIAELAAMPLLVDFTSRVLDEWERISHFYFQHVTSARLPQAQEEHRQIVSLLRSGDAELLDDLAITHNRAANQAYQSMLQGQ